MSSQKGNVKKGKQAHQNSYKFKHNPNSRTTRTISHAPLDFCCERCLKKLQWKVQYRKYNPKTVPGVCNLCDKNNIYKGHRHICDGCSENFMVCSMCISPCTHFAKPNRPGKNFVSVNAGETKKELLLMEEILKNLKERHRRTVMRKIENKEKIVFDESIGLINKDTDEIMFTLEELNFEPNEDYDENDDVNENFDCNDEEINKALFQDDHNDDDINEENLKKERLKLLKMEMLFRKQQFKEKEKLEKEINDKKIADDIINEVTETVIISKSNNQKKIDKS
jgi:hypothetical protein